MTRSNFQSNIWTHHFRHLWTYAWPQIYPNPIPNHNTWAYHSINIYKLNNTYEMIQSNFQSNTLTPQFRHLWTLCIIRYTQIQSEIPIPRLTIILKSKNETTRGNWTNPISNQIFLNICMTLDIGQSNSKYQYFGLPSYQYLGMIKTKIDFKSNRYEPIQFRILIHRLTIL